MNLLTPPLAEQGMLIGENPDFQTGERLGLLDFSGATFEGRPITNLVLLDMWAKITGHEIVISDPVTEEGAAINAAIEKISNGEDWARDCFLSALILIPRQ